MPKQIPNEKIIEALIECATYKEAAARIGCSTRTIQDRMKDYEFMADLQAGRADAYRAIQRRLADAQSIALDMLIETVNNAQASTSDRIRAAALILDKGAAAAQAVIDYELRTAQRLRDAPRLEAERNGDIFIDGVGAFSPDSIQARTSAGMIKELFRN